MNKTFKIKPLNMAMDNQKYKEEVIEFLGEENLNYFKSLDEDGLILAWGSVLHGRVGMQVRNFLRNKFPEIDEQFSDYGQIEDWSWELFNEILDEYEPENEKEVL